MIRSTWFASFWSLERNQLAVLSIRCLILVVVVVLWIRFLILVVIVVLWIKVEFWVNLGSLPKDTTNI